MSDNRIITKCITESSPLSSGAELQIQKIAAQISARVRYRSIGNPLALIISAMALEACGSSAAGGSNYKYSWSRGEQLPPITEEQSAQGLRLNGVNIADVTFARNPVIGNQFTTADVTLTIAESSQGTADDSSVVLSYAEIPVSDSSSPVSYYQGVEKVRFDTIELNLIYQRQFGGSDDAVTIPKVTTDGSDSADLIIGFDIAGYYIATIPAFVRDHIQAGPGDDYVYGLKGDDRLSGNAGDDTLYGGAGDDTLQGDADDDTLYGGVGDDEFSGGDGSDALYGGAGDDSLDGGPGNDTLDGGAGDDTFYFSKGNGDDEITEKANEGNDTLILVGFSTTNAQRVERVDDAGVADTNGSHLKLTFTNTVLGGSILLKDSFNNDETGVDTIIFDSSENGKFDTDETVWLDETFANMLT